MQNISNYLRSGFNNLSTSETINAVKNNFLYSFAFTACMTGNLEAGLTVGLLASLVTFVDAATRPIFRDLFNTRNYELYQAAIVTVSNLAITNVLIAPFTRIKINLLRSTVASIGAYILINHFNNGQGNYWTRLFFV